MKTLIIYDNDGYIISMRQGQPSPRVPVGIPYLEVEIPEDKQILITDGIGVDVSANPHEVMLEDIPKTDMDRLKEENVTIKQSMAELAELIIEIGGM